MRATQWVAPTGLGDGGGGCGGGGPVGGCPRIIYRVLGWGRGSGGAAGWGDRGIGWG